MPAGAVLVYTPKNREELAVCYSFFLEAYHLACKFGKELPGKEHRYSI
jgi:hypothetical protein